MFSTVPMLISHDILERNQFLHESGYFDDWFFLVVEKGSFHYTMANQDKTVAENDAVFFPSKLPFRRKVIEPIVIHHFQIEWPKDGFSGNDNPGLPVGKITYVDKERVSSTLHLLRQLSTAPVNSDDLPYLKQHLLNDLWTQYLIESQCAAILSEERITDTMVRDATRYFRSAIGEKIQLHEIVKKFGLTHTQFIRRFKKALNITPTEYILSLKLIKAKTLLTDTDLPISQIAEICGFTNEFYFSNFFKKHTGISPTSYRKAHIV